MDIKDECPTDPMRDRLLLESQAAALAEQRARLAREREALNAHVNSLRDATRQPGQAPRAPAA